MHSVRHVSDIHFASRQLILAVHVGTHLFQCVQGHTCFNVCYNLKSKRMKRAHGWSTNETQRHNMNSKNESAASNSSHGEASNSSHGAGSNSLWWTSFDRLYLTLLQAATHGMRFSQMPVPLPMCLVVREQGAVCLCGDVHRAANAFSANFSRPV